MDKLPVFFYHTPPTKGYRITFAGKIANDILVVSAAICTPKDNFCRKTGRMKSESRLTGGKILGNFPITLVTQKTSETIMKELHRCEKVLKGRLRSKKRPFLAKIN